ncbi:helix-turn-helix domain-containing protein [Paenibacillus contaminans]|nr:helix-turn-helix domain-containing protein [Paenibacillus contaminans]
MVEAKIKRGLTYWKNMVIVLLATCLPAVLIGSSIYYVGNDRIIRELNGAHQAQLKQTIQRFDDYLSHLEVFSAQMAFQPDFNESLNEVDFSRQFEKTRDLYKSLQLMKQSNPLIDTITLYLQKTETTISDMNGVNRVASDKDKEMYRSLLSDSRSIYVTDVKETKAVVIRLPSDGSATPFGAFLVSLNQKVLDRLVDNFATEDGTAFLMDMDGNSVTSDRAAANAGKLPLKDALKREVLAIGSDGSTFVYAFDGISYSVSHGQLSRLGSKWMYVSATPISQITQPVTAMSKAIIIVSLLGLAIALVISWFTSNRVYRPIQRLMNLFQPSKEAVVSHSNEIAYIEAQWKQQLLERHELQTRIQQSLPSIREGFLQQFFEGRFYYLTERDVAERLQQFEWDVEGKQFAFLVVKLHRTANLAGKITVRDEQLVAFAATNIIDELCHSLAQHVHVFNFQDSSVGAMLVMPKELTAEELKKRMIQLSKDISGTIGNLLRLQVTIALSRMSDNIMHTPELLEEARKTIRYRHMTEVNQLLDAEDFYSPAEEPLAAFPFELEKEIIHDLRMGLEREAVLHVRQFMESLQQQLGTELRVQEGMLKLLGSIYDAIWKSGMNPHQLYKDSHLFEMLLNIREPDDMVDWFHGKVIRPYVNALSKSYDTGMKEIVDKLLAVLQDEYLSNVSLDQYAERLGVSVFKLSRGFKQVTGENFIDYVTRLRLGKCMELLLTTDLKVNEIAERLQYNPPYFVRVFKKHTGMTPGQYREKHKSM